jgi:hypothetical protein
MDINLSILPQSLLMEVLLIYPYMDINLPILPQSLLRLPRRLPSGVRLRA